MNAKFIISDVCYILINGVKCELYQGNNKKPFYYDGSKEIYLNHTDKLELNSLIKSTVKAV